MTPPVDRLVDDLLAHVGRTDVLAGVEAVYAEGDRVAGEHGAACEACGRCCRFVEFGHVLYVTSPELIHVLTRLGSPAGVLAATTGPLSDEADCLPGEVCPMQSGGQCGIRAVRPLGCRLFFCRPAGNQWVGPLLERMHGRLRRLCETCSMPYGYVEWTGALKAVFRHLC